MAEAPGDDEALRVVSALTGAGLTIAVAESLTGGLLGATLTDVPGSSAVVRGGFIVYATDLKSELAGVDPALLARYGPVHPEVAVQLAAGARTGCRADIGIGLTGVAGPGPADGHPAGTFHVALVGPQGSGDTITLAASRQVPGDRTEVRRAAVRTALELVEAYLERRGTPRASEAFH